jgi:Flp pilus assembly protein TadB
MTSPDLDELAALWKTDPDPAEQERMELLASRARRRGRLLAYADIALAIFIVGGTIFGALVVQGPVTMVAALLLAFGTIWLTFKLRTARQMSRTLDTRDRESFIESSVRNVRADLRRYALGLIFVPVLVPIVIVWKVSLRHGGRIPNPAEAMLDWAQSTRGIVTMCLMAVAAAVVLRSRRKLKRELRQLEQLSSAYREEGTKDEE